MPKISPEVRRKILERLTSTPERKALLERARPTLEELLQDPGLRRAYIFGSFASEKPKPSDIDLILRFKDQDAIQQAAEKAPFFKRRAFLERNLFRPKSIDEKVPGYEELKRRRKVAVEALSGLDVHEDKTLTSFKGIRDAGKAKYGPKHKWVRILGAAGLAGGATLAGADEAKALPLSKEVRAAYNLARKRLGKGAKTLYHSSQSPKDLLKEGPQPELWHDLQWTEAEPHKPLGTYFSPTFKGLNEVAFGYGTPKEFARSESPIRALLGKDSKVLTLKEKELKRRFFKYAKENNRYTPKQLESNWEKMQEAHNDWSEHLKDKYDAVYIIDMFDPKGGEEVILLNPKKLKMFWENMKWPAVAGAVGAGALAQPDEASAFPIGKATRFTKKLAERTSASSSSKRLIGVTFRGKVVKDVLKTRGDWRYIVFEDGEALPMTKDYLNALIRAVGTKQYVDKFQAAPAKEKLFQAEVALGRSGRATRVEPTKTYKKFHEAYLEYVKKLDPNLYPDTVYAQDLTTRQLIHLPRPYAELLQKKGLVKITSEPKVRRPQ